MTKPSVWVPVAGGLRGGVLAQSAGSLWAELVTRWCS